MPWGDRAAVAIVAAVDPSPRRPTRLPAVWLLLANGCSLAAPLAAPATTPAAATVRGHAHNDYLHLHPLRDALRAGCTSVEADVFLVDGVLLVGHERALLQPHRSLQRLYLEPLQAAVREHGGAVHPAGARAHGELPFVLLIDIKRDGADVYRRLQQELAPYQPMLTRFVGDRIEPGAVTVLLSGDRPRALVARDHVRWVALDGRPDDLAGAASAALVPLVSDAWNRHFTWDGIDPMPADERTRLVAFADRARAQGRLLRFWGAPDRPLAWSTLAACGVTVINTDRLREFAAWAALPD